MGYTDLVFHVHIIGHMCIFLPDIIFLQSNLRAHDRQFMNVGSLEFIPNEPKDYNEEANYSF